MAFRNPVHKLPASSIIGPIPGSQISGSVALADMAARSQLADLATLATSATTATSAGSATSVTGPVNGGQVTPGSLPGTALAPGGVEFSHLTSGIIASLGQKWWDFGGSAARWTNKGAVGTTVSSVSAADASGGTVMRVSGYGILYRPDVLIPYDPRVLYRVSATMRQTVAGSDTTQQKVYVGLAGFAADKTSYVNQVGANAISTQAYCSAKGVQLAADSTMQTFTGYVSGYGATVGDVGTNPSMLSPMKLHPNVRYISPLLYLNYNGGTGTCEVDTVTIEVVPTGPVDGRVNVVPGTILADALSADAIDGKTITGVTVNAATMNGVTVNGVTVTGSSTVTGATVQTGASGRRVVLAPDGNTYWYTGAAGEFAPGRIQSEGGTTPALSLYGPRMDDMQDYGIQLRETGASTTAVLNTDTTTVVGDMAVSGNFSAGNIAWGSVSINPVINTDTSITVTGVNLNSLGSYRVFLTVNSQFPSVLKAATATGASSDGFTLWVNRSTNAATNVWWLMLAK
jgi:hypothetical protein